MFFDLNVVEGADAMRAVTSQQGASRGQPLCTSQIGLRLGDLGWHCVALARDHSSASTSSASTSNAPMQDDSSDLHLFARGHEALVLRDPGQLLRVSRVNLTWAQVEQSASLVQRCRRKFDLVAW